MNGKYNPLLNWGKRPTYDSYVCKNCDQAFKAYSEAKYCPYCGEHSLFNISFEERMNTL
jgi:rRNA maturation endonuclease Nob1